jgi:hypothetical protein
VSVLASRVDSIQVRNVATSMAANNGSVRRLCAQLAGLFPVIPSGWGRRCIVPRLDGFVTIDTGRRVRDRHKGPDKVCMGASGWGIKIMDLLQFTKFLANPGTRTTLPADHCGLLTGQSNGVYHVCDVP